MKIILDEQVTETRYDVGDIIVLKSGTYFIHKQPGGNDYFLLSETMEHYANGAWTSIEKMINSVKGNPYFKHYPKKSFQLKIVKNINKL